MSEKLLEKTSELLPGAQLAKEQVLIDNATTRVSFWRIRPGEQTGWHRHEFDYTTYQMSDGHLHLRNKDGSDLTIDYKPGTARYFAAPVEHNATNVGDVDIQVLEVEYKKR